MNSKLERFVVEALAAAGFSVVSPKVAFRLRPDIWPVRMECLVSFNASPQEIVRFLQTLEAVILLEVRFVGDPNWHLVGARSLNVLQSRIEDITGLDVQELRKYVDEKAVPVPVSKEVEGNPIPSWPCQERTERLRKLGVIEDPAFKSPQRFGGRITG